MSLKQKTMAGLFWTFSQKFCVQLINFIVQIILARLLAPADFGIIGMITVFMAIGNSLMDGGLTSSLIRTPHADQRDYSTVFYLNIAGSLLIYVVLFVAAPLIARFYRQEILTAVIRIYTLSFVIRAFVAVQTTRLTKEMNFKMQMLIQVPSVIAGGITGIVLAYFGGGIWSLVWMNLVQVFLFTVQHWIYTGWKPGLIFDRQRMRHHFNFGYKLTLSGLLNTIYQNGYNLIIGKYFSATILGYYTRAQTLQMFPLLNISTALNNVTYPMFASIQHDNGRLKSVYKRLMQQVVFLVTPLMLSLAIIAEPLFRFLLTDKWLPAVPYFRILCAAGILYPLHVYNLNVLNVKGRSDLFFRLEIIKKLFVTAGIACALPFGIYGLLYFQVVSSVFSFVVNTYYSGTLIGYPMTEQLKDVSPIFILAALTGCFAWAADAMLVRSYGIHDLQRIIIIAGGYFTIYLGTGYIAKIAAVTEIKHLVLKKTGL